MKGLRSQAKACATMLIVLAGCSRPAKPPAPLAAKAFGVAIAEVGGGKQATGFGTALDQPVVVQVNDAQGSPVAGALVEFHTAGGTRSEEHTSELQSLRHLVC